MTIGTYILALLIVLLYISINGIYIDCGYLMYPLTFASFIHILNKLQDTQDDFLFTLGKGKLEIKTEMFLALIFFSFTLTYSLFTQSYLMSYIRLCLCLATCLFLQMKLISTAWFKH